MVESKEAKASVLKEIMQAAKRARGAKPKKKKDGEKKDEAVGELTISFGAGTQA